MPKHSRLNKTQRTILEYYFKSSDMGTSYLKGYPSAIRYGPTVLRCKVLKFFRSDQVKFYIALGIENWPSDAIYMANIKRKREILERERLGLPPLSQEMIEQDRLSLKPNNQEDNTND